MDPVAVVEDSKVAEVVPEVNTEVKPEVPDTVEAVKEPENELAYIEENGFTSEIFKVEIRGLPKFYGVGELRKLINGKLKLNLAKIKLPRPGSPWAYVCFRNQEEREGGIKALDGYKWKGTVLQASEAKPAPDPLVKRRNEQRDDDRFTKKRKTVAECTTPLAHLAYPEQLKQKTKEIDEILKKLSKDMWKNNPEDRAFIAEQQKKYNGYPCEFEAIKESPKVEGYRNKCEFTIGKDMFNETVVGFRLGSYATGFTEVGEIGELKQIPDVMKQAVAAFQTFVRSQEKLEVFNPEKQSGHLRQLMARSSDLDGGQLMLVVGFNPQTLTEEEVKVFTDDLTKFFKEGDGKDVSVTSLYYQEMKKKDQNQKRDLIHHLFGTTHITDRILGLNFRISPEAFFQVNTAAAEVLYSTAIELGAVTPETTVLDICCGTGTIGLCFAKHCKQVLGVEIIDEAVMDAKYNAEANKIENCKFFTGNSDDFIRSLMHEAGVGDKDVLAIVDPPRAGLHQKSILQLRNARGLNRMIYVSCAPKLVSKNWLDLTKPCSKTMKGDPFVLKKATAVDLFPHTPHMELVLLFERNVEPEVVPEAVAVPIPETVTEKVPEVESVAEPVTVPEPMVMDG